MPFCRECGKEIQNDWVSCPFCSELIMASSNISGIQDSVVMGDINTVINDSKSISEAYKKALEEIEEEKQIKLQKETDKILEKSRKEKEKEIARKNIIREELEKKVTHNLKIIEKAWNEIQSEEITRSKYNELNRIVHGISRHDHFSNICTASYSLSNLLIDNNSSSVRIPLFSNKVSTNDKITIYECYSNKYYDDSKTVMTNEVRPITKLVLPSKTTIHLRDFAKKIEQKLSTLDKNIVFKFKSINIIEVILLVSLLFGSITFLIYILVEVIPNI